MGSRKERVVLHLADGVREVVDAGEIFFLEAQGGETRVRLGGRKARMDVRALSEVLRHVPKGAFFRIHRSYAVHLDRIRLVRRRRRGQDWEVRLEPPVNRVLPVSERELPRLLAALEGDG